MVGVNSLLIIYALIFFNLYFPCFVMFIMMIKILIRFTIFAVIFEFIPCNASERENKTKLLDENCLSNDECIDSNANCNQAKGVCDCGYEYYATSEQKCVKYKLHKESCKTDNECLNGYCSRDKVCVCKPGSLPMGDNFKYCSPTYLRFNRNKFGERCEFFECDPEALLTCGFRKKCECVPNHEYKNGVCVKKAYDWYRESKTTKDYSGVYSSGSGGSNSGGTTRDSSSNKTNYTMFYMIFLFFMAAIGLCLCGWCCVKLCASDDTPTYQNDISLLGTNPNSSNFNVSSQPLTGDQHNVINNSFRVSSGNNATFGNNTPNTPYNIMPSAPPVNYQPQQQRQQMVFENKPPSYNEVAYYSQK